jgi:two-component system cell cycle response regulator
VIVDIDFFKSINDKCGYLAGNAVLGRFGEIFKEELRISDLVFQGLGNYVNDDSEDDEPGNGEPVLARDGGEEFSVILPNTNLEDAGLVAERIRKRMEKVVVEYQSSTKGALKIPFTVSIGVAEANDGDPDFASLKDRADSALGIAKQKWGRNTAIGSVHTKSGHMTYRCFSPGDRKPPPGKPRK